MSSLLVTQTVQQTQILTSANTNSEHKKVEVQIDWPTAFIDTNYTAVASSSSSRPLTIQEAGERDRVPSGMLVVSYLLDGATPGDLITVHAIGRGYINSP